MSLKAFFPAKQLEQIPVANKPLRQGGKVEYLSAKEFKEKFDCEFTESIWGTEEQAEHYQKIWHQALKNKSKLTELELQVIDRLNNPLSDIAICFINEKVGHGLFAQKDIPAGTILGVYSGTLEKPKAYEEAHDDYVYALGKNTHDVKNLQTVSSKERGGISRFMQHLPVNCQRHKTHVMSELKKPEVLAKAMNASVEQVKELYKSKGIDDKYLNDFVNELMQNTVTDHEFEDISFTSGAVKYDVATSNVDVKQINCCGCPMAVMVAEYPIKAGEQIGFSYGAKYWQTCHRYPELFRTDGALLEHSQYKRQKLCISFSDPNNKYSELPLEDATEVFVKDIERNKPISAVVSETEEIPLSVYDLRDKLVQANAVEEKRFGELNAPIFALRLKEKFIGTQFSDVSIKTYYQNPTKSTGSLNGHTVDVVCKVSDGKKLSELANFFKPIEKRIKTFSETNELVVTGSNVVDENDESFKNFFKTLI